MQMLHVSCVFAQAKEGNIEEGSAAWEDMSAQDQQRRKRGIEDMKMKLRSPNFFVSPLRLSVRNIPMTFSEGKLKQLMIQAVRRVLSNTQCIASLCLATPQSEHGFTGEGAGCNRAPASQAGMCFATVLCCQAHPALEP